jgi:hypothetical protein
MSRSGAGLRVSVVALCAIFSASLAHAQYRASIQGVVTDQQGALVSGATVTLKSQETNRQLQSTTNAEGVYNFVELGPSRYTITVEMGGFKTYTATDVQIISEQSNAFNVSLQVGTAGEQVQVNGDAVPLIDTQTATVSGTVTAQQIQALPSFGRDVFQLAQLAPGVFGDGARSDSGDSNALPGNAGPGGSGATSGIFATENGPQVSAGGGRRELNNIQLDGVGITSVSWAGTAVITPNEDSVKEVKVVSNSYDAEDGRYPGAQIKVISQNGTNTYHGSAFFKADRPGLNAFTRRGINGVFDPKRNNARFNDFGGSVGGPIIHNKLFGFFSYETVRNHGTTNYQDYFPTSQLLALAQPGSAAALYANYPGVLVTGGTLEEDAGSGHTCSDIGLVEGSNCTFIPGQGLNVGRPLTSPLGTTDPSWTDVFNPGVGGDGLGGANNLDPTTPNFAFYNVDTLDNSVNVQYNFRVDYNLTSKDLLAFSMYYVPTSNDSFNGSPVPMNLFHHEVVNEAETLLWNHTFSPSLLNEARINAAGWRWQDLNNNPNGAWGLPVINFAQVNSPTDSNGVMLGYGTAGISGLGEGVPGTFDQWTYAVKDVLTKVHGSHTIKLGGEITRLEFVDLAPWNARPTYFFHNIWDFINDAPREEQATFNPLTGVPSDFRKDTRSNIYGFFAQDDFKVRSNLTLNLGLRWEYNGPISDKGNNLGIVELGSGQNALTGMRVRKGGNLYSPSKNDFGPQLGFAWSPGHFNNRFVLRGGFGIGFTGQEEATSLNGRNNPPFLSPAFNLTNSFCTDPPACTTLQNQVVYGPTTFPADVHSFHGYGANPFGTASFDPNTNLPLPGPNFSPIDLTGYPSHWDDTRTYRYSVEGQYDLGRQWVATLGYQGTATRNLTRQYNLNLLLFAQQGVAFNPLVPHVDWYDEGGRANFNALLAEVRHQFGHSFQFNAQYRYSRAMDTGSNNYANGNYQFTMNEDYGKSDYDSAHAYKFFGMWSPTLFHGPHGWIEKIAGNWTLSGILNAHSGFPYNPIYNNFCDAIYAGSCGGGGTSSLRPAAYLGGASGDHGNDAFIRQGGDFPNGAAAYFTQPSFTAGPDFSAVVAGATPGPIPGAPGIVRNAFVGPHYFDIDATISKAFGLPNMKLLGENAKIEFRANFFNLFNNLNLTNIQGDLNNTHFGQPQAALGARTIEMQARFSF